MKPTVRALALALLLYLPFAASAALTTLYSTRFESSEGYNRNYELWGQKGWTGDSTSTSGGNGLLTNYVNTQAAYVGLFSLVPSSSDYIGVYYPLNYSPIAAGNPLIKFSVNMTVVDSTTTNRDDFYWRVYNMQNQLLFTLDFYNDDLGIYYSLGTNGWVYSGSTFTNDGVYTLNLTMDFSRNSWTASLDGQDLVGNQPLASAGEELTLGDIDAAWFIPNPKAPGDNFMIFDNYKVTAEPAPGATLSWLGRTGNGQALLRLTGPEGSKYAIEAGQDLRSWSALKTNVVTGGYFDYVDTAAAGYSARYYRARWVP